MTAQKLNVFALNRQTEIRHTFLTRSAGDAPVLPDLAHWIGVKDLDPNEIELFPLSDLGDMMLSDYLASAFDVMPAQMANAAPKLNALDGSVLLVPDRALKGSPTPGPNATLIATLPMAQPDHNAQDLPKTHGGTLAGTGPTEAAEPPTGRSMRALFTLFAAAIVALLIWLVLT